jgi:hypothetical protein
VSEERASGDGFRRTVTTPPLQGRLVAVAALEPGHDLALATFDRLL